MGVSGFIPFIQKAYPHIVHNLPGRLKDFTGKKFVIDGTLITQRFHYAPSPYPYRHVLGWYNLVKELKEFGVEALCIFDGESRSAAKANELGRRREQRKLTNLRGTLELSRTKRLHDLKSTISGFETLDKEGKKSIADLLQKLNPSGFNVDHDVDVGMKDDLDKVGEKLKVLKEVEVEGTIVKEEKIVEPDLIIMDLGQDDGRMAKSDVVPVEAQSQDMTPLVNEKEIGRSSITEEQVVEVEDVGPKEDVMMPSVLEKEIEEPTIDDESVHICTQDTAKPLVPETEVKGQQVGRKPSVEVIKSSLLDSFRDFKTSVAKVASTPVSVPSPTTTIMDEQTEEDLILSKTQHELTLEEGKLWNELTQATTQFSMYQTQTQDALDHFVLHSTEDRLHALTTKSETVSDSYQRRMQAPTKDTYSESKEILEAMGIPCYVIEGTCEGEALASSLVHQGLADYVVTEDSDVLAYEAPMIRNITSRNSLTLIHGADVRQELKLSHEEYVDFIILLGTDFSQRIKNVGPSRAYKFIQEHGNIENVVKHESKYSPRTSRSEYLAQVKTARAIFNGLPPIPDRLAISGLGEDPAKVSVIMERCGFGRVLMLNENCCKDALSGNYFSDDPVVERI